MFDDTDIEKFRAYFSPKFDNAPLKRIRVLSSTCLKYVSNFVGPPSIINPIIDGFDFVYVSWADEALYNLIAHYLILDASVDMGLETPTDRGIVTTKVDTLSETFGVKLVTRSWDKHFLTTPYGRRFLTIKTLQGNTAIGVG